MSEGTAALEESPSSETGVGGASPLRVQGLHCFHRVGTVETPILKDVCFEVPRGRFYAIMGPSGSGKSTLLHLLCGLDAPSAGTVEIDGQDLAALGERGRALLRREKIGLVFQFFNLIPNLDVSENVGLPLRIQGRPEREVKARVAELLARFQLEHRARHRPNQLSGGEMQRVSIARAMSTSPPILLADEPTGNLASGQGEEAMRWLRSLTDEHGQTVLLVTHNPRDAAYGDEVHFLLDGQLRKDPVLQRPNVSIDAVHEALRDLGI